MTNLETGYTDMIADLKRLFGKINALYDFFSRDNKYIKQIPFQHEKLSAAKSLIENAGDKNIEFDKLEPYEIEAELTEMVSLITDSKKFLSDIVIEIEKITGKKIRFRSEL